MVFLIYIYKILSLKNFWVEKVRFLSPKRTGKTLDNKEHKAHVMTHILSCYWWKNLSFPSGWETGRGWGRNCAALTQHEPVGKLALPLLLALTQKNMYGHTLHTCMLRDQKLCVFLCVGVGAGVPLLDSLDKSLFWNRYCDSCFFLRFIKHAILEKPKNSNI